MSKQDDADAVKLAQGIARMKAAVPAMLDFLPVQAQMLRKKFETLVNQGFTSEQALELCKGSLLH